MRIPGKAGVFAAILLAALGWWFRDALPLPGGGENAGPSDGRNTLSVASFNIQVFGTSKLSKPAVMRSLAEIVRRFDVVAIQEIRCKDPRLLPQFISLINAEGHEYDFVIGPRLGRSVSKEQYAYVFNTRRVTVVDGSVYTVPDPHDLLHREPLVATFRVRGPPASEALTFTLINIHTDPDVARREVNLLKSVFMAVRQNGAGEDDVILLGDLNVDQRYYGELATLPHVSWAIDDQYTNTRRTKAYDNIVFDGKATTEFTGRSGVFDMMNELGMSQSEALAVSDHLPVWAEFQTTEARDLKSVAAGESARR